MPLAPLRKKKTLGRIAVSCRVSAVSNKPLERDESPSLWLSSRGDVAHPDAPLGAGGEGHFKSPIPMGSLGNRSHTLPHPSSCCGRRHVMSDSETEVVEASKQKVNPPPKTQPQSKKLKRKIGKLVEVDVEIKIGEDIMNDSTVKDAAAVTEIDIGGVAPEFPGWETKGEGEDEKVTKLVGKIVYKGALTIQTRYHPDHKPEDIVGYGRGTTDDDRKAGNVTVGFHEHCHQMDLWNWLQNIKFPGFTGKVGMTVTEFNEKADEMDDAWANYFVEANAKTYELTDDVGSPTEAEYVAKK